MIIKTERSQTEDLENINKIKCYRCNGKGCCVCCWNGWIPEGSNLIYSSNREGRRYFSRQISEIEYIIKKYKEGFPISQIAKEIGRYRLFVKVVLKDNGYLSDGRKSLYWQKEARQLYQDHLKGRSIEELAAMYNVSRSTVYKTIQNKGVKKHG